MTTTPAVEASYTCPVCAHYFTLRIGVVSMWIVIWSDRKDLCASDLAVAYRASVHERHLAGGSLSTRPDTAVRRRPGGHITVKRACNGCGKSLGDATSAELDAAMCGSPFPDVRLECGCLPEKAAA